METQTALNTQTLSAKEWALTILISGIPFIGLIMLLVWAFSEGTNIHKKNWAKGGLILMLVAIAILFSFLFLFGGMALISNLNN